MSIIDLLNNISFLTPTTRLKELLLLQHIETSSNSTQKEMAKVISAAPSMVNAYLNEYEDNKYIKRKYISAKLVKYLITPEGIKRKNYLSITYLHELLKLYNLAQENVDNFLKELEDCGYRKVLLYGGGEVAEIILEMIGKRENNLIDVVAVIDDKMEKTNKKLLGYSIIQRKDIKKHKHDLVIITSYAFEDKIMENLKEIDYPVSRVRKFFIK